MIICESCGALPVYRFVLIGSDCLHGSGWRCVFLTHFQESVSPAVHSAESGPPPAARHPPPTTPPCCRLPPHYPVYMPSSSADRYIPIYCGWQCMNRAANSSGSFNEGRSDLKVRTEGSAERLLVQILWRVNRECGRDDRMMFDHVWLYLIVIIRTSSDIFCFRWNKEEISANLHDGNIFIS